MNPITIGEYIYNPKKIGKGSFSVVFQGFHKKTKAVCAVKKIDLNDKTMFKRMKYEIDLMKTLKHENIVKLYDYFYDNDDLYLILEYCNKGDLSMFLNHKALKEVYAKKYMKQLSNGLKYLASKNIIHRDLKPQNILIGNDGLLKITDFSFAKILNNNDMLQTICGSPLYMSPEIIKYKNYSNKSDLWSIGMILYELLTGKSPYKASTHYELIKKIDTTPIMLPKCIHITDSCKDLLHGLLQRKVKLRISWDDFFNHKWFADPPDIVNPGLNEEFDFNDLFTYNSDKTDIEDDISELQKIKQSIDSKEINLNDTLQNDYFLDDIINFTPPDEPNGFIVVDNNLQQSSSFRDKGNVKRLLEKHIENNERTLAGSLYNYMNQSINYFKTYIKTLPNPECNDYL